MQLCALYAGMATDVVYIFVVGLCSRGTSSQRVDDLLIKKTHLFRWGIWRGSRACFSYEINPLTSLLLHNKQRTHGATAALKTLSHKFRKNTFSGTSSLSLDSSLDCWRCSILAGPSGWFQGFTITPGFRSLRTHPLFLGGRGGYICILRQTVQMRRCWLVIIQMLCENSVDERLWDECARFHHRAIWSLL